MADPNFNGQAVESTSEFLFGLDMFAGIPKLLTKRGSELSPAAEFLKICQEFEFKRGSVIAHKLDVAEGMYIFRSGTVDAWEVSFNNEHQEQEFKWLKSFEKDDILGDVWLFEPGQHHRLLRARKGGSFILIKKSDFLKFISRNKSVLKMMYPHMSDRAKEEIYLSGLAPYLRSSNGRFGSQRGDRAELVKEDGTLVKNLPAPVQNIKLLPDELIFYHSQRSWKILTFWLVIRAVITFLILVGVYLALFFSGINVTNALLIALGIAMVPALSTLVYWIDWRNAFFLVTSNQLIRSEKKLLQFNSALEKVDINKVQSIAIEKSNFLQKWFNVGTAQITTAAQDTVVYFDYIDQPEQVERAIVEVQSTYSSIAMGKRRAEMRAVIHNHFGVNNGIKKVNGFKPTPREKSFRQKMQEVFVRSETKEGITYHKHPIALLRFLLWPSVASAVLILIWYVVNFFSVVGETAGPTVNAVLIFLSIATLFWFVWEFADWQNDTFQVTNQYIYDIDRLPLGLSESRKQAELNRIENVRTEKNGILPTLFNFGAVHVETAGAENNIVFENVKDPDAVQAAIFKKRQEYENKLAKRGAEGNLDMMTTLIEMYDEANAQRRIHQFRELPDPHDEYDDEF